jgi:hypothetical protein
MQFARTIFPDSATFIEKKKIENRLWPKSEFLWPKKIKSLDSSFPSPAMSLVLGQDRPAVGVASNEADRLDGQAGPASTICRSL